VEVVGHEDEGEELDVVELVGAGEDGADLLVDPG
jgi:hypothetical protein